MTLPQPPLGLELPILQAPTGSVAGPELCAAISMAGAMGAMGLTWTAPEDAVRFVRQVRAATTRPFLVNFALAFEPHALGLVLEAGAPVIAFSWGDPSELVPMVRASGALFGIQVSNLDGAKRALSLGADFLIAQGVEAGGHVQSTTPLLTLLESVLPVTGATPVIAAGGLATGRDIGNVLRLGAAGAMLGTRFVATRESRAHDVYRERLVAESRTALTCCFDGG